MSESHGAAHDSGNTGPGEHSFLRASASTSNGLAQLSSLNFDFAGEETEVDPVEAKRSFSDSINALKAALDVYQVELESRENAFAQAFSEYEDDTHLLAASDHLHDSLESLGLAHTIWTGHSFIPGPLYRNWPGSIEDPAVIAAMLEAEEQENEEENTGAPFTELGITLAMDTMLHGDGERFITLNTVRVFSTGIELDVGALFLRGKAENAMAWHTRCNEQLSYLDLEVTMNDPSTRTLYESLMSGGEGIHDARGYRLKHTFWIHKAVQATELAGAITLVNGVSSSGDSSILKVNFALEPELLKETASRIRTLDG